MAGVAAAAVWAAQQPLDKRLFRCRNDDVQHPRHGQRPRTCRRTLPPHLRGAGSPRRPSRTRHEYLSGRSRRSAEQRVQVGHARLGQHDERGLRSGGVIAEGDRDELSGDEILKRLGDDRLGDLGHAE